MKRTKDEFCIYGGHQAVVWQVEQARTAKSVLMSHDHVKQERKTTVEYTIFTNKNLPAHLNVYLMFYLTDPKKIGDKIKVLFGQRHQSQRADVL